MIAPGKEIRAADDKGLDRSIRQPRVDRSPACAAISGKKDAAASSPGKEVRAADGKRQDCSIRQARVHGRPASAAIGRKKDAAASSPGKEVRAGDGKTLDDMASACTGLNPLSGQIGGEQNEGECKTGKLGFHLVLLSTQPL